MRKNLIALALVGIFSAPCTSQAISAEHPAAPAAKMFSAVDLNTETVFAGTGNIVLQAGEQKFVLIFEKTFYMDDAQKVRRWEGYLASDKNLKASFIRGLSGYITGMIDTPQGRLLVGNANGKYFLYSEESGGSGANDGSIPSSFRWVRKAEGGVKKPAEAAYMTEFDAVSAATVPVGGSFNLALPGVGDFEVMHDETAAGDKTGAVFVGHLKDYGTDFRMQVSYSETGAEGYILTPQGEFRLETIAGQQWLIDMQRSGLHSHVADHDDSAPPVAGMVANALAVAPNAGMAQAGATTTPTVTSTTAASTTTATAAKPVVDLLVLYSPGFESAYGGANQALTRIQLFTAMTNTAYKDSLVNMEVRLVGAEKINIADTTSNSTTLGDLAAARGAFASVPALRAKYGADLVVLVRPFYMNAQAGSCGVGYIGGYGGQDISLYKNLGYSVVSDGRDRAGTAYYCTDYTFAHELGHNMGSMHDRVTVASQGGGTGAYPYGFGYGMSGSFGTIMSYINPRVGKFSAPTVKCTTQFNCGVTETDTKNSANNALSLNNTAAKVAAFSQPVALPVTLSGVVSVGTTPLLNVTLTPSATTVKCTTSASNGMYSCTAPNGWSGTITPTLSGYTFNPGSASVSNVTASKTGVNFAGTAILVKSTTPTTTTTATKPSTTTATTTTKTYTTKINGVTYVTTITTTVTTISNKTTTSFSVTTKRL